jgi:hypothetical protein
MVGGIYGRFDMSEEERNEEKCDRTSSEKNSNSTFLARNVPYGMVMRILEDKTSRMSIRNTVGMNINGCY